LFSPTFIDSNGEKRNQLCDLYLTPVDGNRYLLRGSITINKHSKNGFWTSGDIVVSDVFGNQRFEGRNDYVWNMYVNNPLEDIAPPVYEKGSLNYLLTDTIVEGVKAQNLKISFRVTDNIGIGENAMGVKINRDNSYSLGSSPGYYDEERKIGVVNYIIPDYYSSASYHVSYFGISDLAGNNTDIFFSDSPLDEPIKKIYVKTNNPDDEAPELDVNRITVYAEPTNKEFPDGETLVTINYYVRDNNSGLDLAYYTLRDPQGVEHALYHYNKSSGELFFDGDPTVWTKYTIKCVLPQGSAPGIWGLSRISIRDKALNERTYNFVETLIFEPDNSTTDYVLFSEMKEDGMIYLKITSESQSSYGFNYRVINENTGKELSGTINKGSSSIKTAEINASSLGDDPLLVIVQIKNTTNEVVAVRSSYIAGRNITSILPVEKTSSDLMVRGGYGEIAITSIKREMVTIYHISGRLVYQALVDEGTIIISLPAGFYVVNRDKVVVK
ncbi:hypothetical protein LJB97_04280, partial [Parabacteroides sp. OttesenSCG-928-O15]|nr:hypothetical protein [Parabacteroides sp. OttesenSCG-928-O15]